jgi:hypothetical protein
LFLKAWNVAPYIKAVTRAGGVQKYGTEDLGLRGRLEINRA